MDYSKTRALWSLEEKERREGEKKCPGKVGGVSTRREEGKRKERGKEGPFADGGGCSASITVLYSTTCTEEQNCANFTLNLYPHNICT